MATSKKRYVCLLVAQQLKAYCCVSVLGFLYETSLFEYLEFSKREIFHIKSCEQTDNKQTHKCKKLKICATSMKVSDQLIKMTGS